MRTVLQYVKHFLVVSLVLLVVGFVVLVSQKGTVGYNNNDLAYKVGGEGPHVFISHDHMTALYIRGDRENGFHREERVLDGAGTIELPVYFPLDESEFTVQISERIESPASVYNDGESIIAISDIEGNYKTFRDFLIAHNVIDDKLNWAFGKGHLVLLGDFVDRGFSTTQVLWFIYRLEKLADAAGGKVHYILGNHEIKNLQGNFKSVANKYLPVTGLLNKPLYELFGPDALLGKWLESKNVAESINGYLFVHGGLHPSLASQNVTLQQVNDIVRNKYRDWHFPGSTDSELEELLTSTKTGIAWYRGFINGDIEQEQLTSVLDSLSSKAVVVGHTLQFKVNRSFNGKVFAIDVKHPDDYQDSFPTKHSEGLLITNDGYYRLLDDGNRKEI